MNRFAQPVPADVRLTNGVATALYGVVACMVLAAAGLWVWRAPWLPIQRIQVVGDLSRNNVATLRANVASRLQGNFFSIDLHKTRATFEAVPWVRHAEVRRIWPNTLRVTLSEHRATALWQTEDGNEQLVNTHGEVFEANTGDVEDDGLPSLEGPQGSAAQVLALYRRLTPLATRMDAEIDTLRLSGRGSWRMELDNGAVIELGRGTEDELATRLDRFVRTLAQVQQRYPAPVQTADLRHRDGYALKLRGITTMATAAPEPKR
jgi:cell division protein FtsQ